MEIAQVRNAFEFILDSWRKAQVLKSKAESYRLSATGGGIRYDKDRVQTSPEDYQAQWIEKAADCEAEAIKILEMSDGVRQNIYAWVEACCTEDEQFVLIWHYINGKTYAEIRDEYTELFDYKTRMTMYNIAERGMKKIADNL